MKPNPNTYAASEDEQNPEAKKAILLYVLVRFDPQLACGESALYFADTCASTVALLLYELLAVRIPTKLESSSVRKCCFEKLLGLVHQSLTSSYNTCLSMSVMHLHPKEHYTSDTGQRCWCNIYLPAYDWPNASSLRNLSGLSLYLRN